MEKTPPFSPGPAHVPARDESNTELRPRAEHGTPSQPCTTSQNHDIPDIILQPEEASLASCPLSDRREQKRD